MVINLSFKRSDFEDIYFKNGQYSYFKGVNTKKPFKNLLLSISFLILATVYSVWVNNYDLYAIAMLAFLIFSFVYLNRVYAIWKIKNVIKKHLDYIGGFTKNTLILSETTLSFIQDSKETIIKLNSFERVLIEDNFIELSGVEKILIPRNSMLDFEFIELKNFLSIFKL